MRWGRSGWRGGEGKLSRLETRFKFKVLEFQGLGPKILRMTAGQLKPLVDYEESARPGMYVHSATWPYNTPGNDTLKSHYKMVVTITSIVSMIS